MSVTMAMSLGFLGTFVLVLPVYSQMQASPPAQTYPNELLAELFSPGGFNAGLRTATETPPVGPPPVCWTSSCLRYTLLHKTPTYERRRYEKMAVVVAEDSSGWMAPMINYFKLKLYFDEAQNVQNVTMPLVFPVITALQASRGHMTMMPIPPQYQSSPPTPTLRSVRIEYLPAMEVLVKRSDLTSEQLYEGRSEEYISIFTRVKGDNGFRRRPYQSLAFGAGNEDAVNKFRMSLGHMVPMASGAAFVADYVPATEFFNRRSEIWLISRYIRQPRPSVFPGK